MAKKSLIQKEIKKKKLVAKFFERRQLLREMIKNQETDSLEKQRVQFQLQKLPRNSSYIRVRNRCELTGRPHGYYRKFGLSRNKLREAVMRGDVPGVTKASW